MNALSEVPQPNNSGRPIATTITYRYKTKMVYVKPATSHEMAVQWAQQELPELADIEPERIALYLNVNVKGQAQRVRIGAMSWEDVVKTLAQYEIIEVVVENTRSRNAKTSGVMLDDAPPSYPYDDKSSHSHYLASPTAPGSRSRSRSPGLLSRALGWVKPNAPEESDQ